MAEQELVEGTPAWARNEIARRDAAIQERDAQIEALRGQVRESVFKDAGFAVETPAGKALLKLHDGDLSVDALKATAAEYGFVPAAGDSTSPPADLSPVEIERLQAQSRFDAVAAASLPNTTPTLQDEIAEAEANGDIAKSLALKDQWMKELASQRR